MKFEPGPYYTIDFDEKNTIGFPLKNIIGFYPRGDITPFPNITEGLLGMANLEGRVVPIQDPISIINPKIDKDVETYIIMVKTYTGEFGLLVPTQFNVINISKEQVDRALKIHDEENFKNILSVKQEGKLLIILDPNIPYKPGEIFSQLNKLLSQRDLEINS